MRRRGVEPQRRLSAAEQMEIIEIENEIIGICGAVGGELAALSYFPFKDNSMNFHSHSNSIEFIFSFHNIHLISSIKWKLLFFFMKWRKIYYKSKIDWWICGMKWNKWINQLRLPIQLLSLSHLALPNGRDGEEKESWRAWPPWAYWEWTNKEWNEFICDWTMKRREQPSSTNTQTLNSLPHLLPADKEWSLNVLGWNGIVWFVVLAALSLGGLRAASSPHCSAQRETSSSKQHNKENNGMKASAAPNPRQREGAASELSLLGVMGRSPSAPLNFTPKQTKFPFPFRQFCLNPLIIKEETSAAWSFLFLLELMNKGWSGRDWMEWYSWAIQL